jgi:hypothetical protein
MGFITSGYRKGERRSRRLASLAVLALLVGVLAVPQFAHPPQASAFGTLNGLLGQRGEHEMITRAALACAPGVQSTGQCFEPRSMDQLAGHDGTFGAVGAPDVDEMREPTAHCDNADFLNVPGYPQSRPLATAQLLACVAHLRQRFDQGIAGAAGLFDADGNLQGDQVDLSSDCTFAFSGTGRAKCDAIEGFGRALHGVQDFYSHSNWADQSDPSQPIGIDNPPGLNLPAPSPILDLMDDAPTPVIPVDLTTGFYAGIFGDKCPSRSGRITHACLNKDDAQIDPVTGSTAGTDPATETVRGQVLSNEQKAVTAAIVETRQQWADFRQELITTYGAELGNRMILAITQDVPKVDVVFAIDTTGSMSPYISDAVDAANQIVDELSGRGPDQRLTDFRIGLVDYKDVDSQDPGCPPDYDAETDLPFSTAGSDITSALGTLPGKVGGGCDIPEDVLSGVQTAVNFPWRSGVTKAIIVMGDAAGHDPEQHSGLTSASVIAAANAVDPASVYPILVGSDPDATSFMTNLASGTGGQVFDSNTAGGVGPALLNAITAITSAPPGGDTTPPAVAVHFPAAPADQGAVFNGAQAPVTGTVTATDPSGVSAIDCSDGIGGLTEGPLTLGAGSTATRTLTVTGDGQHVIVCQATDNSGAHNAGDGEGSSPAAALEIDSTPPTVACAASPAMLSPADGRLVPVTATVTVSDAFSGPAGFTLQSVTSSDPGSDASIQGFETGTPDTSGQLQATHPGRVYTLTYQGTDLAGNTATCQATVTVGGITVDRMVSATEEKSASPVKSPPLTTSSDGELVLAFISADGPAGQVQQVTQVTGGGLTWTPAARADAVPGTGTAEVWQARASAPVTAAVITAALRYKGWDGAITVVAYTGAAPATGATGARGGTAGAASATLTTTRAGSLVWAAGHDWSRAARQTPLTGQALVVQDLDHRVHDTYWVQQAGAIPDTGTKLTIGTLAPTGDRWELAAVEISPAA